jgi:hypothetical protein
MYIYQIVHKKTGSLFTGARGQTFYSAPKYAISSFNNIYGKERFQNQIEWELARYRLVRDKGFTGSLDDDE